MSHASGTSGSIKYGWSSSDAPASCSYVAPPILRLCSDFGAKRILDLGCGNGELVHRLASEGYDVVGVERDEEGIAIARGRCAGVPVCHSINWR